mmetsp:Transcript_4517/g.7747  ORF Transcript_4517/g.7747 Transcript_4517/m.7747 type:complete len:605 (+) Transcript_4517:103-1917(+)
MTSQTTVQALGSAMDALRAIVPTPPCEQRDLKSVTPEKVSPCKGEVIMLSPHSLDESPSGAPLADVEARLQCLTAELAVLHSTVDSEATRCGVPLEKIYEDIKLQSTADFFDLQALQREVPLEVMYDALDGVESSRTRTLGGDTVRECNQKRGAMSPASSDRALSLDSVFDITPTERLTPGSRFSTPERAFQLHQELPERTPLSPESCKPQSMRTGLSKVDQAGELPKAGEAAVLHRPGSLELPMPKWSARATACKKLEQVPLAASHGHGNNVQASEATIAALNTKIDALHAMLSKNGSDFGATATVEKNVQKMWHSLSELIRSAETMAEQARHLQSEVEEKATDPSSTDKKCIVGTTSAEVLPDGTSTRDEIDSEMSERGDDACSTTNASLASAQVQLCEAGRSSSPIRSSMPQFPAGSVVSRSTIRLPLPPPSAALPATATPRSHRASFGALPAVPTPSSQKASFIAPPARTASAAALPQGRSQSPVRRASAGLPPFVPPPKVAATPPRAAPAWNRRHTLGHARPGQCGFAPPQTSASFAGHSTASAGLLASHNSSQPNLFAYSGQSAALRPVSVTRASTPRAATPCALRPSNSALNFRFGQ